MGMGNGNYKTNKRVTIINYKPSRDSYRTPDVEVLYKVYHSTPDMWTYSRDNYKKWVGFTILQFSYSGTKLRPLVDFSNFD